MSRGSRATRIAGAVPLLAGFASAAALTGAAFFTVEQASCGDPGGYLRHGDHIELVGGCVDPAELPGSRPGLEQPEDARDYGFSQP